MKLIRRLVLKFGENTGAAPLHFEPTGVTIFVGPNNSGKSLVLREIEKVCATDNKAGNHILEYIDFNIPETQVIKNDLLSKQAKPNKDENVPSGSIIVQRINTYTGLRAREIIPLGNLTAWADGVHSVQVARYYISLLTVRLDGQTRTTLLNPQASGDLIGTPVNTLSALFLDDESRETIRKLTAEAFGTYFTIDALRGGHLRARMAERPPDDYQEEQSLDTRAREYHRNALEIIETSDGVKAFTGMIATVLGQKYRIALVDEPEAFLHPPLAKRLGKELAELAVNREADVISSTHSADFLMGCISGSPLVNIVRLTYKNGKATARLLKHDRLAEIIKSPLMRSTGVLSALFHEGAVACEADSDRALYQEINDRLLQFETDNSAEAIFLNAHSKQSTAKLAGPLREMGIPAAVVVDFDIFKPNNDFKHLLKDLKIPEALASGWGQSKGQIAHYCEDAGINWKSRGREDVTRQDMLSALDNLLHNLRKYGIFVVPNGELESWFVDIGLEYTGNKSKWLLDAFELLGSDPEDPSYMKPEESGIWEFVRSISTWINNPNRNGII